MQFSLVHVKLVLRVDEQQHLHTFMQQSFACIGDEPGLHWTAARLVAVTQETSCPPLKKARPTCCYRWATTPTADFPPRETDTLQSLNC